MPRRPGAPAIDALLIDETIELPGQMVEYVAASRRRLPVVGVPLDAAAHTGLIRVLEQSRAIVGISSGATLFCLERIAWDHGFRLTGRSQWCSDDASRREVAAFLDEAGLPIVVTSPLARTYRPSRTDGTLHAWAMRKSPSARFGQGRRETRS